MSTESAEIQEEKEVASLLEVVKEEQIKEEKKEPVTIKLSQKQLEKFQKVTNEKAALQKQAQIIEQQFKKLDLLEGDFIDLVLDANGIDGINVASIKAGKDGTEIIIELK